MQIFKYFFSRPIIILIYAGLALPIAAAGVNTYLIIAHGLNSANIAYDILQYVLTYLVSAIGLVLLISLLISSYYAIDGKKFITSFGIIKSKYDIDKIQTLVLDRNTNKLTVYFDENTFIVVVLKPDWNEKFTDALLAANNKIEFTIQSKDTDKHNDKGQNG
ncbi:MAG: hypothetical protein K2L42_01805 [Clostridia bacterium]|nr:hypothetical protein [Clostridia bacterium]